jgi:hypothetical protein
MFVEYEPGAYIERIGPTPLLMVVAAGDQRHRRSQGIATEQAWQRLKPLICTFAPLAGLEPAPYGLEVRQRVSA